MSDEKEKEWEEYVNSNLPYTTLFPRVSFNAGYDARNEEINRLEKENARLREALEFYADKENWSYVNQYSKTLMKDDHDFNVNFSDKFGGKRARQALKGSEE